MFERPAMRSVRERNPALFSPADNTMQLFQWQRDIVGVAHYIMGCLMYTFLLPLMMQSTHLYEKQL